MRLARKIIAVLLAGMVSFACLPSIALAKTDDSLPMLQVSASKVSKSYVGKYVYKYYTTKSMSSYAGRIGPGQLYATRTLQIKSVKGNKVKFRVLFNSANTAAGSNSTGWITGRVKNGKLTFNYRSAKYWDEGTGYLKFSGGKVTMRIKTTYCLSGMGRQSLGMTRAMVMRKGVHRVN